MMGASSTLPTLMYVFTVVYFVWERIGPSSPFSAVEARRGGRFLARKTVGEWAVHFWSSLYCKRSTVGWKRGTVRLREHSDSVKCMGMGNGCSSGSPPVVLNDKSTAMQKHTPRQALYRGHHSTTLVNVIELEEGGL